MYLVSNDSVIVSPCKVRDIQCILFELCIQDTVVIISIIISNCYMLPLGPGPGKCINTYNITYVCVYLFIHNLNNITIIIIVFMLRTCICVSLYIQNIVYI